IRLVLRLYFVFFDCNARSSLFEDDNGWTTASWLDPGNKAIPALWDGLDVATLGCCFIERLSQQRYSHLEIAVVVKGICPYSIHQLIFGHDMAAILDQDEQPLEGFWGKRHRFAIAQENALVPIKFERAEFVQLLAAAQRGAIRAHGNHRS